MLITAACSENCQSCTSVLCSECQAGYYLNVSAGYSCTGKFKVFFKLPTCHVVDYRYVTELTVFLAENFKWAQSAIHSVIYVTLVIFARLCRFWNNFIPLQIERSFDFHWEWYSSQTEWKCEPVFLELTETLEFRCCKRTSKCLKLVS